MLRNALNMWNLIYTTSDKSFVEPDGHVVCTLLPCIRSMCSCLTKRVTEWAIVLDRSRTTESSFGCTQPHVIHDAPEVFERA